jgi:hypothetical protein
VPIIILVGLKKNDGWNIVGNRIRRNNRLAKKYLSQARNNLTTGLFYIALESDAQFLKTKLNIEHQR